jgi:hypothetical protein
MGNGPHKLMMTNNGSNKEGDKLAIEEKELYLALFI